MNRRRRIYEGKAKILYEGPEPGTLVQHFKDDATAFNKKKHDIVDGKGMPRKSLARAVAAVVGRMAPKKVRWQTGLWCLHSLFWTLARVIGATVKSVGCSVLMKMGPLARVP